MLAHLGFVAAPAPLDWLTMLTGLVLAASFIVAARRGLMAQRQSLPVAEATEAPDRRARILENGTMNGALKPARLAFLIALATLAICAPAAAQEATGDWAGSIEAAPGTRLPLVLHIKQDDAGALGGTVDSPMQGVRGLRLAGVTVEGGSLSFTVPAIGASYKRRWDAAAKAWKGEWSQAGQRWPLSFAVPAPPPPLPTDWRLPPDAEIGKLSAARNAPRAGQGIVLGVLGPDGQRIVADGTGPGAKFDGSTLFEIGSITKVFTALILADMVNKGEVSLDDPAAKFLPSGHRLPERAGAGSPWATSRRTARGCHAWPTTWDRSTILTALS